MRRMRTFVAIRCGPEIGLRLRRETERLEPHGGFRAPDSDDFHLTLHFLGDTDERDLGALGHALEEAAAAVRPFEVRYGGLGAFPDAARARVVWAAVEEVGPQGMLQALVTAVGERLGAVGYPPEARRFHPHVTLGRLRRRPDEALVAAIQEGEGRDLGTEWMSELELILSDPGDRGYRYITLTTVGFDDPSES